MDAPVWASCHGIVEVKCGLSGECRGVGNKRATDHRCQD